jgi:hypothetical protein
MNVPLFLPDFNQNLILLVDFRNMLKYQMPIEAELFHADERADRQTYRHVRHT